ncbi:hypothetical protein ACFWUZ_04990 [Streptomyces sp. NPDC058646]|uniref:hypothetical protein n=1 Tax=Streptomyces sp. NPDC058646 TaxID=3346574 RepID=UPI0036600F36
MTSTHPKSPLKTVSGLLSFVRFLVPGGYEVYGYVVMLALGLAVGAAGDALGRRAR